MAKAVRDLPTEFQEMIEVREWDMRSPDAREYFAKKKVKKLPSIAIDGNIAFEALIPDQDELIDAILNGTCSRG